MKIRLFGLLSLILLLLMSYSLDAEGADGIRDLCYEYIEAWKQFYPSQAFSRGFLDSIFGFEDYSQECITNWLTFNKKTLTDIAQQESILALQDRIDARLLRIQIQSEIDKWENETPHKNSPALYSRSISQAVRGVLTSELLMPGEKVGIILSRLNAVNKMCTSAVRQLETGSSNSIVRSLKALEESARFYASKLPDMASDGIGLKDSEEFHTKCRHTASQIRSLTSQRLANTAVLEQGTSSKIAS